MLGTSVVVGAASVPELIDTAILHRFDNRNYVGLPKLEAKSKTLKIHLRQKRYSLEPSDIRELVHIMDLMKDLPGNDVGETIKKSQRKLISEIASAETWEMVDICNLPNENTMSTDDWHDRYLLMEVSSSCPPSPPTAIRTNLSKALGRTSMRTIRDCFANYLLPSKGWSKNSKTPNLLMILTRSIRM